MADGKVPTVPPQQQPRGALKRKRGGITFSPTPIVHEFDFRSPTKRRAGRARVNGVASLDDAELRWELEARGHKVPSPEKKKRVTKRQRTIVAAEFHRELAEELLQYGLSPYARPSEAGDGDGGAGAGAGAGAAAAAVPSIGAAGPLLPHDELVHRLKVARTIHRRAQLRALMVELSPIELDPSSLRAGCAKRKLAVAGRTRLQLVDELEGALLKDSQKLCGDGYEFGRHMVSIDDCLSMMSDAEMRAEIKARGVKAPRRKAEKYKVLSELIEGEQEKQMQRRLRQVLLDDVRRRGLTIQGMAQRDRIEAAASVAAGYALGVTAEGGSAGTGAGDGAPQTASASAGTPDGELAEDGVDIDALSVDELFWRICKYEEEDEEMPHVTATEDGDSGCCVQ